MSINTIDGTSGNDVLVGTPGDDAINGFEGNDTLSGGDGNDALYSGGGLDNLQGGNGDDLLVADGPVSFGSSFSGGVGADTLRVTVAAASFAAVPGVNFVPLMATGFSGIETLQFGSNSGETLRVLMNPGQLAGLTTLEGGAGTDVLVVSVTTPGTYTLPGFNLVNWTDGTDTLVLTAGSSSGSFTLNAADHAGLVVLGGGIGNDVLNGSDGVETLNGGAGNDVLEGEGGNDVLNGGAGADVLVGDDGDDILTGGTESDMFNPSLGHDIVTDFAVGIDKFDLRGVHFMNFAELQPYLSQSGNDVVWSYLYDGIVNTLTLQNVQLANLTANDILFANPTDPVNVSSIDNGDDLVSTDNADVLLGMNGNDVIDGAGGNDLILGYGGDDLLDGGAGRDTLLGGGGVDTFRMALGDIAGDRIGDYQLGETLAISGAPASASAYRLSAFGADTHLEIDTDGNGSTDATLILSGHVQGQISVAPWSVDASYRAVSIVANPQNATITLMDPGTTDAVMVHYLVTFDTPTAGVSVQDFALSASGVSGASIQSVAAQPGNGTQFIVTVSTGSGNGTLSLGLADSLVTASQPSTGGYTPTMGDIGDLNGDDRADLVLPNYYSANVAVMLGNRDGTFAPTALYASAGVGGNYSNYAKLGDFNGDGKLDIVTTNYSEQSVSVLLGNGDGTFQGWIATPLGLAGDSPMVVDLDGDGREDVVMGVSAGQVAFLRGNGDGTFAAPAFIGSPGGQQYAFADMSGDGKAELLIKYSDHIDVLAVGVGGSLSQASSVALGATINSQTLLAADVNGDGANDIVFNDYSGSRIGVALNSGSGFGNAAYFAFPNANPINITATDANGDGKLDILGTGESGAAVLLGNGDGTFAGSQTFATGIANRGTFGDLNGDGKTDLVTTNFFTSEVNILLNVAGDGATYTISKNDAPVAQNVALGVDEDTALEGQVSATDANDNSLTYGLVDGPQHGQLAFGVDGSFEYTPSADFAGLDQFTWRANDGILDSNVSTVTLTVNPVNDAPLVETLNFTGTEDEVISGQLTASDVEGDTVTYALVDGPQNGELALNPSGSFTYTPAPDINGHDSFTFTVSDGQAESTLATVNLSIAAANDAPVAEAGSISGDEDTEIAGQVAALDADGDALTYAVTGDAAHGQVVMAGNGSFTYTPEANYFGEDSFTFVANDGTADSSAKTFTITINPVDNDPAVIAGDLAAEITESSQAGGPDGTVSGQLTALDPDGETSFNADALAGTYGSFTVDEAGAWLYTLDEAAPTTQALQSGDTVTDSFVVTTADGSAQAVTVTVHGANDSAVFSGEFEGTVTEAATLNGTSQVTGTLTVSDPDDSTALAAQVIAGQHGTLTLAADGNWTYVLDNSNEAVDGLSSGEGLTDTVTVSAVDGTQQDITITIAGADDIRNGTNAADTLLGTSGNDTLNGNGGNDTLIGGLGNDLLNGGNGTDTASYAGLASGATVSLAVTSAQDTGGGGLDTLVSIENLIGTSHDDVLAGNGSANVLTGGDGNDTIDGGAGADTLNGGNGIDTASFASSTSAVTVSLASQGGAQNTGAGNDTLIGFENLLGSLLNDTLTGDAAANVIDGSDGNDTLNGGLGDDRLIGGAGIDTATYANATALVSVNLATGLASGAAGNDTLVGIEKVTGSNFNDILIGDVNANVLNGGTGDDTLSGGAGANTLNGGTGIDTASYAGAAAGVTVSLAITAAQNSLGAGTDTLIAIENLTGSAFGDRLTGSGGANLIDGGDGNDIIDGGAGADTLVGGLGIDTLAYASTGSAVTVNLATGQASGGGGTDIVSGFENLLGSGFNDTLTGDANANVISGGAGNDIITGGLGNDTLNGEAGTDTASYANAAAGVVANLLTGSATGADGNDTLIAIENLTGSNYNDSLTGDANANLLTGGSGDDLLDGGAGSDTLNGGAGIDTASYASATSGVTVSLAVTAAQATGGSGSDTLSAIENLTGSAFNDTLTGSSLANVLDGAAGNDRLIGGAGADTLIGGSGNDTCVYTATANSTPAAFDTILDFAHGVDKLELSGIDAIPGGADNAFAWGGTTATVRGVWYAYDGSNNVTHVYGDTDGNAGTREFQVDLVGNVALTQSDFLL